MRLLPLLPLLLAACACGGPAAEGGEAAAPAPDAMTRPDPTDPAPAAPEQPAAAPETPDWSALGEEDWRARLDDEAFRVLREKGTERAFTGEYWDTKTAGLYVCRGCEQELFRSDTKYDSGCGWPSYWQPISEDAVAYHEDRSFGMVRTEVTCGRCGGHLGHVFEDGPEPTGLRFCMNSAALRLVADE